MSEALNGGEPDVLYPSLIRDLFLDLPLKDWMPRPVSGGVKDLYNPVYRWIGFIERTHRYIATVINNT
jgi:hypothetical protein